MSQLTLNLEPALPERFPSLRSFIAHRAAVTAKHMKVQAADLDMAPSTLTRKLNPSEGDTQRFNVDDLEAWLASTGEAPQILEYLAAKFCDSDAARQARLVTKVEALTGELARTLAQLKGTAA